MFAKRASACRLRSCGFLWRRFRSIRRRPEAGSICISLRIFARLTGNSEKPDRPGYDIISQAMGGLMSITGEKGGNPTRCGNAYASIALYDTYQAKDGMVVIGCGNQKLYEKFCNEIIGMPWMISDERFLTVPLRVKNNEIQKKYIEEWSTQYTVEEIVDKILAKGIPAGPIYNVKQITEDEHIAKEREMFVEIEHPVIGKMKVNGNVI